MARPAWAPYIQDFIRGSEEEGLVNLPWISSFPDSPEKLGGVELGLGIVAGVFTLVGVLLGLAALGVHQQKDRILEQRAAPRSITDAQATQFLRILAEGPKGNIHIWWSADPEAEGLAARFRTLLLDAGWTVIGFNASLDTATGITLMIHSREKAPPYSAVLLKALQSLNLSAREGQDIRFPENTLVLSLGFKPRN